jgi:tetratricopeptide (TPR) repeat protein
LRLRLAEALLERQQMEEARLLFREEWESEPGEPRAAFGLGLIALDRGENEVATELLIAALKSPTARRAATAHLAALARARGDEGAAARFDEEVAPRVTDRAAWPDPFVEQIIRLQVGLDTRTREAEALSREGHHREAAEIYLRELEGRRSARACIGAGLNLARLQPPPFDHALALLREAVQLDPNSPQAHYSLALVLLQRAYDTPGAAAAGGWLREATREARRAAELKPDYAYAYLRWGQALHRLGEPAQAVPPLRKAVECQPENLEMHLALGEALLGSGQLKEAAQRLQDARRIDPDDKRVADALERLRKKGG